MKQIQMGLSTSFSGAHSSALQSASSEEALTTEKRSFRPPDFEFRNLPRGLGDAKTQPFGDSKTFDMVDQIREDSWVCSIFLLLLREQTRPRR